MSEKNDSNANKSSSAFLTFWTTLPGILTGAAALITAIVGLYLALGPRNNNQNAVTSPTPRVTPKSDVRSGDCLEQEYAKVDPVEVGSGTQVLTTKDGVTRAKLTDQHVVVGVLRFRFHYVGAYFEIEEMLDSNCKPVERVRNLSRQKPVDENNKPQNWDTLQIPLAGREYSLRLGCEGGCSAVLTKL
jgi:hypothetical protein